MMRRAIFAAALCLLGVGSADAGCYPNDWSTVPPNTVIANTSLWAECPTPVALGMSVTRSAIAANDTTTTAITIPPNAVMRAIYIQNSTANAVTGGVDIGTTAAGVDVASAVAVGANGLVIVVPTALLKQWFSATAAQQLFLTAHTGWNSASLNVRFVYDQ